MRAGTKGREMFAFGPSWDVYLHSAPQHPEFGYAARAEHALCAKDSIEAA
jgi:hypothetical protein